MAKTVFQRYTTESGERYEFELTDEGIIYLYDRSSKNRSQLNEGDRAAIERGLITIGDWESDSAAYQKALDSFVKGLKQAKSDLHGLRKPAPKKPAAKKRKK
jgi:hypothetical protein